MDENSLGPQLGNLSLRWAVPGSRCRGRVRAWSIRTVRFGVSGRTRKGINRVQRKNCLS